MVDYNHKWLQSSEVTFVARPSGLLTGRCVARYANLNLANFTYHRTLYETIISKRFKIKEVNISSTR